MSTWRITSTSNVNSKKLLHDITSFAEDCIDGMGIIWSHETHRESFVDLIDEMLEEEASKGTIVQWNVMCDRRNNKHEDMIKGKYIIDIYYRQKNCLNKTHLQYTIEPDNMKMVTT